MQTVPRRCTVPLVEVSRKSRVCASPNEAILRMLVRMKSFDSRAETQRVGPLSDSNPEVQPNLQLSSFLPPRSSHSALPDIQFIPHAPPQHPPPLSQLEDGDELDEPPLPITADAGTLISRMCLVDRHEGQTMSSATSRVL